MENPYLKYPRISDLVSLPFETFTGLFVAFGHRLSDMKTREHGEDSLYMDNGIDLNDMGRIICYTAATYSRGASFALSWIPKFIEDKVAGIRIESYLNNLSPHLDLEYGGWFTFSDPREDSKKH